MISVLVWKVQERKPSFKCPHCIICKQISSLTDFSRGSAGSGNFQIQRAGRNNDEKLCHKSA